MPELSQGAYLAWRLAAGETARTMHPCIEKEFVLIGLCRLGKWLRSKAQGENTPLRGQALQAGEHRSSDSRGGTASVRDSP